MILSVACDNMDNQQTQRIDWIDSAKGIGIILVLIGHCSLPGGSLIYMFHMLLFYIISGYLWNSEKNRKLSLIDFVTKKINAYIIPYFKIASICFLLYGVVYCGILNSQSHEYVEQLWKWLYGIIIFSRGTTEWLPCCSPIWFLTALFVAEIFFYFIMKYNRPLLLIIIATLIGFALSNIVKLPWNIDNAFTAIPYLSLGYYIRKYNILSLLIRYKLVLLVGLTVFVLAFGNKLNDYDGNEFGNYFMSLAQSSIISLSILAVIRHFSGGGIFSWYGKNTIFLMGYNYIINEIAFSLPLPTIWLKPIYVILIITLVLLLLKRIPKVYQILV